MKGAMRALWGCRWAAHILASALIGLSCSGSAIPDATPTVLPVASPTSSEPTPEDTAAVDLDGDGFSGLADCDDNDPTVNPSADEVCDDSESDPIDNNCDGRIDEGQPAGALVFYLDVDTDGYGTSDVTVVACEPPPNYVSDGGDCDDERADVNPDAMEVCDAADVDENCNGFADDADGSVSADTQSLFFVDADVDGYGSQDGAGDLFCDAPDGLSDNNLDCDDTSNLYHPGAVEDDCEDPNDYNCDGLNPVADGTAGCDVCVDSDSTGDDACGEPTASAEAFAAALLQAYSFGAQLVATVQDIEAAQASSELAGVEAQCDALESVFGFELAAEDDADGWHTVDQTFKYQDGQCNNLWETVATNGRPALVVGSLDFGALFYEYTVIDMNTGFAYQSCRGVNSGCNTAALEFYGPVYPAAEATVVGSFDYDQRRALEEAIRDGYNFQRS